MRLLFAGTPEVALPSLDLLLEAPGHEVVAVLTRPDARAGRGRHLVAGPVKQRAVDVGLPVLDPRDLRAPEVAAAVAELDLDAAAVVAYGALLPPELLGIPRHGWVNLHFSLLPAWRGAAPVQHAIRHGDDVTGATTFLIGPGLDDGPVLGTLVEEIGPRDTAGDLLDRLARSGAELLRATLDGLETGTVVAVPQPGDGVSQAPRVTTEDARIRWDHPALVIDRMVRSCTPAPGAWTVGPDGARLRLGPVRLRPDVTGLAPGELAVGRRDVVVGTATHGVELGDVAPAGKRPMPAADWARGARLDGASRLGTANEDRT